MEKMRKILLVVLACLSILAAASVTAAFFESYYMPHEAEVPPPEITMYLDDALWNNGTLCQWGNVTPGESYTHNFTVANHGLTTVEAWITTAELPTDWNFTWTMDHTVILPSQVVSGDLVLTVGSNVTSGKYEWAMWIHVQES